MSKITIEELLYGYTNGIFPMAEADGTIYWYSPDPRAIIPIENYKPSKSLRPVLNKNTFEIRYNTCFRAVMQSCAKPRYENDETWISGDIIEVYSELHSKGLAHSVEAFLEGKLVGGLYGVSIGSAFFGESMFYTHPNASKVAFHYLIEKLKTQKFTLLDTQFINDNVLRYGAIEISKESYLKKLNSAIRKRTRFIPLEKN
jgi:leucyl/phenylalanyl-tRNA---protein transferase